jgi:hypothetical protein
MLLTLEQRQASDPTCLRTRQVFTRIQLHADRRTMPDISDNRIRIYFFLAVFRAGFRTGFRAGFLAGFLDGFLAVFLVAILMLLRRSQVT